MHFYSVLISHVAKCKNVEEKAWGHEVELQGKEGDQVKAQGDRAVWGRQEVVVEVRKGRGWWADGGSTEGRGGRDPRLLSRHQTPSFCQTSLGPAG